MKVDKNGMLVDGRIQSRRFSNLEHGALNQINAIVVHQTDSSTDQSTFNCYSSPSRQEGAHFLIGVMGTIYQTASIKCCCYHVGKLRSRCMVLGPKGCADAVAVKIAAMNTKPSMKATLMNAHEQKKSYPERYPMNRDSLGIELVGKHLGGNTYDAVHRAQQESLMWLVAELAGYFSLGTEDDVFRHPDVSIKNAGEAAAADWMPAGYALPGNPK